ncbi:MAG: hypothetical protein ACR2MO_16225 [Acidimicrobiales bacterium]
MATIGEVVLKITNQPDKKTAVVEVTYDINFDSYDQGSDQVYQEVCRLIGDDTNVGDPQSAGTDDTIGFLTPLFFRNTRAGGQAKLSRHWNKTFRMADLDEDRGIPDPDEIRALVTLNPIPPAASMRESNLVVKREP